VNYDQVRLSAQLSEKVTPSKVAPSPRGVYVRRTLRVRAVPLPVRHVRVPVEELTARELARQGGFFCASAVVVARRFSSVAARERDIDVPTPSRGAPDGFVFLCFSPLRQSGRPRPHYDM